MDRGDSARSRAVRRVQAGRQEGASSRATRRPRSLPCHAASLERRHLVEPRALGLAAVPKSDRHRPFRHFSLARVELRPSQSASWSVCSSAAICCSPRQDRASSSSCTCARSLLLPQHHRTIAGQPDGAVAAQARLRRAGPSRAGASTRRGRLRSNLRQ
jgi:hypothetical protein